MYQDRQVSTESNKAFQTTINTDVDRLAQTISMPI